MSKPIPYVPGTLSDMLHKLAAMAKPTRKNLWGKIGLAVIIAYIFLCKDISIDLEFTNDAAQSAQHIAASAGNAFSDAPRAVNTSLKEEPARKKAPKKQKTDSNAANTFSNMPFDGELDSEAKKAEKIKKMKAYVKQYAKYAQAEMAKHGIPASITLAQGLLESDAGESRLAVDNNNHFGIKCFSRTCKRGHCSNFTDDTHKDFFRKYKSPSESFKAHSALLQGSRYKFLYQYRDDDYVSWAKGLKSAGYATDPNYAGKLINLIRELDLHDYDR